MRRLIAAGDLQPVGSGRYNAKLYDRDEIDVIGKRLALGHFADRIRRVIVHETLVDQATALETAGLHVCHANSVMDGLSQHEGEGMPIMFLPAALEGTEANLALTLVDGMYLVLIGEWDDAHERLRRRGAVIPADELRRVVQHAWKLVGDRRQQVTLKI